MRRLLYAGLGALAALFLLPTASAQCQPVCLPDLQDLLEGNAEGPVAVSLFGNADGDLVAVSGTGNAEGGLVAVTVLANSPGNSDGGAVGVSGSGNAEAAVLAVSGDGNAEGLVAVSLTGHASGLVAVGGGDLLRALQAAPPPEAGLPLPDLPRRWA